MKVTLIATLLIASLAYTSAIDPSENLPIYVVKGFKGFWLGFESGLYKNARKEIQTQCLNDRVIEDLNKVAHTFDNGFDAGKFFGLFNEIMEIMSTVTNCAFQDTVTDIINFCEIHKESCTS